MKFLSVTQRKLLLTIICMLAAGICYSCKGGPSEKVRMELTEMSQEPESPAESQEETGPAAIVEVPEEPYVYVHVCGMVREPGVYEIPAGSRIYEAVEAAGGFAEGSAGDFLNLAQEVQDGMKIEVPDQEQAALWKEAGSGADAGNASGSGGKVDLNRATKEELMTLKGIGESRAEDILRYREEYGGFQAIEDIMNVPGIKEGAFAKIRDQITV